MGAPGYWRDRPLPDATASDPFRSRERSSSVSSPANFYWAAGRQPRTSDRFEVIVKVCSYPSLARRRTEDAAIGLLSRRQVSSGLAMRYSIPKIDRLMHANLLRCRMAGRWPMRWRTSHLADVVILGRLEPIADPPAA